MSQRILLTLLALLACKPRGEPPICPVFVGSERADEADSRTLPIPIWLATLVPNLRRPEMLPPPTPRDCSGRAIGLHWPTEEAAARDPRTPLSPLAPRPLNEADLKFEPGPRGALLVWARVEFFADGTARGPVALARWAPRGLEIRGVGTLWAPERRPRLRLEPLGDDAQVLVATSEVCTPPTGAPRGKARCRREIYLLPLLEQRFVQAELVEAGVPVGPARIVALEERESPRRDGWVRRSQVRRSVSFVDGHPQINERITHQDCDPKTDQCDPQEAIREKRPLRWDGQKFRVDKPSAWEKATG